MAYEFPPQEPDKITSLGVDREGNIVIVTETTDGGYETTSNSDSLDLNRVIEIFQESARLAELDPDNQSGADTDQSEIPGPNLDKLREELARLRPDYQAPYNEFDNPNGS